MPPTCSPQPTRSWSTPRSTGAPSAEPASRCPWAALADALAAVRGSTTLVLAGGLRSANVAEAVASLAPDVVDVSSGVEESPGVKRHAEVLSFIVQAGRARPAAPPAA
jgi:phosphoribosylanthranilate isomerase